MLLVTAIRILALAFVLSRGIALAVINGTEVDQSRSAASAPLVALQMSEVQPDGKIRYYKGTSLLIAPELLLTAGHNVAYILDPSNVEAIFASAPCWGPNVCNERRVRATTTIVHPQFRQIPGGTEYDIAIVKMVSSAPVDYREIPLANLSTELGTQSIQVLGFGTNSEDATVPLTAFRLRSIELKAIDSSDRLGSEQKFWLDQSGGGICGGDSGGPAIVDGSSFTAIGLAIHVTYSKGKSSCLTQSAFTDILFFHDWLTKAIADLSATDTPQERTARQ
jgi:secreted trypsin-like serine protease